MYSCRNKVNKPEGVAERTKPNSRCILEKFGPVWMVVYLDLWIDTTFKLRWEKIALGQEEIIPTRMSLHGTILWKKMRAKFQIKCIMLWFRVHTSYHIGLSQSEYFSTHLHTFQLHLKMRFIWWTSYASIQTVPWESYALPSLVLQSRFAFCVDRNTQ